MTRMHISRICARNTSRLAYDGSGTVLRDGKNHSLCTFQTGKRYNCDLSAAIASARRAGTTSTLDQMNKYFLHQQMPIISSRYWNMVYGQKAEDVRQDEEGMQIMRYLARNMA